jgi:hypothetical protein
MKRASLLLLLAACGGGDTITVRGNFARAGDAPERVYALEARTEAEVRNGAFEVGGLATSPISLRLLRGGDTVGVLELSGVAAGSSVVLRGVRIDPRTRRAFPSTVELSGTPTATVNGVRVGPLPARVDAAGVVLSASRDGAALLVRPADPDLPDLRVVTSPATAGTATAGLAPGDSVRVRGETERGFVVADRVERQ